MNRHSARYLPRKRNGFYFALTLGILSASVFPVISVFGEPPLSLARGMLTQTYNEEYVFPVQPNDLWRAASEEVQGIEHIRILVSDTNDLVLSWVELSDTNSAPVKAKSKPPSDTSYTAAEPGRGMTPAKNANNSTSPKPHVPPKDLPGLHEAELSEVGEDKVALTTVMITPTAKGSMIRFRRIYYGRHTQPGIAYSTGAYENWLAGKLADRLGLKPSAN